MLLFVLRNYNPSVNGLSGVRPSPPFYSALQKLTRFVYVYEEQGLRADERVVRVQRARVLPR